MVLPAGFVWTDALICTSSSARVAADGVSFDHAGNSGFYTEVDWSNAEKPAEVAGTKF
jgi:hypothetical protein